MRGQSQDSFEGVPAFPFEQLPAVEEMPEELSMVKAVASSEDMPLNTPLELFPFEPLPAPEEAQEELSMVKVVANSEDLPLNIPHDHSEGIEDGDEVSEYDACMRAAEILGFERALTNLAGRPEAAGHTMGALLNALVQCDGLVNKAKHCISAV